MRKMLLIVPLVVFLAGCDYVAWLQPFYAPGDIVAEPGIIGSWRSSDGETWSIAAKDEAYLFTLESETSEGIKLTGYLFRIDGELYADLVDGDATIPDHMLLRMELAGNRMVWSALKSDWIRARVDDRTLNSIRISEGKKDTRWLVNMSPQEAQRFLYSYRYEAWDEETLLLERIK